MSDQPSARKRRTVSATEECPRIIDAHEAARILHSDYYTVRRWVVSGALPTVKFPSVEITKKPTQKRPQKGQGDGPRPIRRLLFDRADVLAFIERCKEAV